MAKRSTSTTKATKATKAKTGTASRTARKGTSRSKATQGMKHGREMAALCREFEAALFRCANVAAPLVEKHLSYKHQDGRRAGIATRIAEAAVAWRRIVSDDAARLSSLTHEH